MKTKMILDEFFDELEEEKIVKKESPAPNTVIENVGVKKLLKIGEELKEIFIEREKVIDNIILTLATGQNMFLIGPPGTGKTKLISEACKRIVEGKYFEWLLNRTTDPGDLIGPYSLKLMEEDRFLRVIDNKMPTADVVYLDEIWKCNEPVLNLLLPIINEKKFYNDGKAINIPLISLFCASNELPMEESLNALYDRLGIRMYVEYIKQDTNKISMISNYIKNNKLETVTTITKKELDSIKKESLEVKVSSDIIKEFIKLINNISNHGIIVSDRRLNKCFDLLRGQALLNGRNKVTVNDFTCLTNTLWQAKEDIPVIEEELLKIIAPFDTELEVYKNNYKKIISEYNFITDKHERIRATLSVKNALEATIKKLVILDKKAKKNGKDTTPITNLKNEIARHCKRIEHEELGMGD